MLEEPLIFEIGSTATTGVDFDEARVPAKAAYAGAQIRRSGTHGPHRLARPLRARDGAALYAAQPPELRNRTRAVPARLMHDEAQPAPPRDDRAVDGICRCPPDRTLPCHAGPTRCVSRTDRKKVERGRVG